MGASINNARTRMLHAIYRIHSLPAAHVAPQAKQHELRGPGAAGGLWLGLLLAWRAQWLLLCASGEKAGLKMLKMFGGVLS